MSQGQACRTPQHRGLWRVTQRKQNRSAFNGYHPTPSAYSEVVCLAATPPALCARWRTKASYVDKLPPYDPTEGTPRS